MRLENNSTSSGQRVLGRDNVEAIDVLVGVRRSPHCHFLAIFMCFERSFSWLVQRRLGFWDRGGRWDIPAEAHSRSTRWWTSAQMVRICFYRRRAALDSKTLRGDEPAECWTVVAQTNYLINISFSIQRNAFV